MLLGVTLISAPLSVPLYLWEYSATNGQTVIWAPLSLFGLFILCLPRWMQQVHRCRQPWQTLGCGSGSTWWRSWSIAFLAGVLGVTLLYGLQLALGWGAWARSADISRRFFLEGLLVGFGVGLAEELIFRGWLLYELEKNYSAMTALWANAVIFAIAHFLRPLDVVFATWPQFVGLVLLGMALVWARHIPLKRYGRKKTVTALGPAAGLHGGLVFAYYQVDANDLIISTQQVSEWVTGIGGNPLAGLLGIGFLGMISGITYSLSHRPIKN